MDRAQVGLMLSPWTLLSRLSPKSRTCWYNQRKTKQNPMICIFYGLYSTYFTLMTKHIALRDNVKFSWPDPLCPLSCTITCTRLLALKQADITIVYVNQWTSSKITPQDLFRLSLYAQFQTTSISVKLKLRFKRRSSWTFMDAVLRALTDRRSCKCLR